MDLQEMIWSSAVPKASRRHSLAAEFSKELLDIILHHGQKKSQPDHLAYARSGSSKTLDYEKSGKVTGKKRCGITSSYFYAGWAQELTAGVISSCSQCDEWLL
jgi:hypothetical protein